MVARYRNRFEMKALQEEGSIAPGSYRFTKDSSTPTPEVNERVFTKSWEEQGLSLPPSEFFVEVLNTYGMQPHYICPKAPPPLQLRHTARRSPRSPPGYPAPPILISREE
jgi:hypothetical protein